MHLTGAGSCTVIAAQPGNANYNPADAVSQSFTIQPPQTPPYRQGQLRLFAGKREGPRHLAEPQAATPPARKHGHQRRVPNVVGMRLAAAKRLIRQRHCRLVVGRGRRR
jgi:hypothetical protein